MNVKIVPAYNYPEEISDLFSEYTNMLTKSDSSFQEYLALQHYERELENLEAKYGPPDGRLYLALYGEKAAGCIGLKKIDDRRCEMKRLYVRPQFRGRKIGEQLVRKIITEAGEIGYSQMLLDTLPFLENAVRMYKKLGFYTTERYNDSPMSASIYMKLDL